MVREIILRLYFATSDSFVECSKLPLELFIVLLRQKMMSGVEHCLSTIQGYQKSDSCRAPILIESNTNLS